MSPSARLLFCCLCALFSFLLSALHAAEPTLNALFPAGGQQGTELTLEADGKFDPWPVKSWISGSGVHIESAEKSGQFKLRIDPDAPIGPQLLRLYNDQGASDLRVFVVGRLVESFEKEPNNRSADAIQVGQLPVTFNGRLDKGEDVDSFALELHAGQRLTAAVDGYGLRSPIDPHLHLFDSSGRRVAFQHDSSNLDPVLSYQAEQDGTYVLELAAFAHPPQANVRFAGSAAAVYRLTMTLGPFGCYAFPTAIAPEIESDVRIYGWNLERAHSWIDTRVRASKDNRCEVSPPDWPRPVYVDVSGVPQRLEQEPNNTVAQAIELAAPVWLHARLDPPGDEDRFRFHAAAGEQFALRIDSLNLGFPADTVLSVERGDSELASNDDRGDDRDPGLNWSAKEEGDYIVRVRELFGRGGENYVYRLVLERAQSDFKVSAGQSSLQVEHGKESALKIKVDRLAGHKDKLIAMVEGLPDGVTLKSAEIPEKGGDVSLTLVADEKAAAFSGPIRAIVKEDGDGRRHAAWFDLREDLLRGDLLVNGTDQLWLTVK